MALALLVLAVPCLGEAPAIGKVEQYTDNRGWNQAGLGPTYQIVVTAAVTPAGYPTLVYAERDGVREPLTHFATADTPGPYVLWMRFDARRGAPWNIVAERNGEKSAPAASPPIAAPWQVPLLGELRVKRNGPRPRLEWTLPDFGARRIDRIQVVVRGEPRVLGRFTSAIYTSPELPPDATSFVIPPGVLAPAGRYVFQVMLDNVEGGELKNRSSTFTDPYSYR